MMAEHPNNENTKIPKRGLLSLVRIDSIDLIADEKFWNWMDYKNNKIKRMMEQSIWNFEHLHFALDELKKLETSSGKVTLFDKVPKNVKMEDFNSDEFLEKIRNHHNNKKI